ncbi:MAG TPA: SCO family protein [Steroidobacteraceae bacterium]|nr:SCO family protein [Steroidobacteraceae bacterium]
MTARSKLLSFVFLCVAAVVGVAAALIWSHKPTVVLATGTVLVPSRALEDFSLIDNQGRSFGAANLRGHWSLMFFGYTNCPDFCPATLTTLAAMQKRLRAAKSVAPPQVIFVSVDAKRDTPSQLAKYVPYFDPDFIGLTAADQPAIERQAKKWGVAVIIEPASDGNYTVDHSGAMFVINPAGNIAAILGGPFTVDALQSDFKRIVTGGA